MGKPVDITELQAFVDLIKDGPPLLTSKPSARVTGQAALEQRADKPVDVDVELDLMDEGASVNAVHCRIIPSLLYTAMHPDEVVQLVVDRTVEMAERKGLGWSRSEEESIVAKRIVSAYNNLLMKKYDPATGVIPSWLPGEFHEAWVERLQEGARPTFAFNNSGFYVRSFRGTAPPAEAKVVGLNGTAPPGEAKVVNLDGTARAAVPAPEKPAPKPRFTLRPFVPLDPATLPPREWLYGRHYQRRTVSATIAPGGFGKTTLGMVEGDVPSSPRRAAGGTVARLVSQRRGQSPGAEPPACRDLSALRNSAGGTGGVVFHDVRQRGAATCRQRLQRVAP
jgi:hypothetical protein